MLDLKNMLKNRLVCTVILVLVTLTMLAQKETDSLVTILEKPGPDTLKFSVMQRLANLFINQNNYTEAKKYAARALILGEKLKRPDYIISANNRLGGIYREMNLYDSAFSCLFKNVKLAESLGNNELSASAYTNLGALYIRMKNYNKAEFYYKKALSIKEKTDQHEVIADINTKLATIYIAQKKYNEAISHLLVSEKLITGLNKEIPTLSNIYGNLGRINMEKGNIDTAIIYFEKTESLGLKIASDQILTRSYYFLSNAYMNKYDRDNKSATLNKALHYAEKLYKLAERFEDDNAKCAAALVLYKAHKLKGNPKEALIYHEIYIKINDTLTQLENSKYIADINFKYETEKQERIIHEIKLEKQMKELELEIEKQRSRNKSIIFLLTSFTLIGLTFLFFYTNKQKQKRKLITLENEKLSAELNFLKAQIDPHTIFNTINTIHGQLTIDVEKGRENLVKFSEILHYQLYDCNEKTVEIEKEIDYLKKYIELQKLRRSKKMELEFSIDENMKDFRIAPLLFVPLVENAFKHASTDSAGKYYIKISLHAANNMVNFNCSNSHSNQSGKNIRSGGIGLENLKKRLERLYKNRYSLNINKTENYFTTELQIHV